MHCTVQKSTKSSARQHSSSVLAPPAGLSVGKHHKHNRHCEQKMTFSRAKMFSVFLISDPIKCPDVLHRLQADVKQSGPCYKEKWSLRWSCWFIWCGLMWSRVTLMSCQQLCLNLWTVWRQITSCLHFTQYTHHSSNKQFITPPLLNSILQLWLQKCRPAV